MEEASVQQRVYLIAGQLFKPKLRHIWKVAKFLNLTISNKKDK
jgi:hypothetical protein